MSGKINAPACGNRSRGAKIVYLDHYRATLQADPGFAWRCERGLMTWRDHVAAYCLKRLDWDAPR